MFLCFFISRLIARTSFARCCLLNLLLLLLVEPVELLGLGEQLDGLLLEPQVRGHRTLDFARDRAAVGSCFIHFDVEAVVLEVSLQFIADFLDRSHGLEVL